MLIEKLDFDGLVDLSPFNQPSSQFFASIYGEVKLQRRCDRNRKRSKRRAIYCPIHQAYLHSVSPKYPLFVERSGKFEKKGVSSKSSQLIIATNTTLVLKDEWLEAFWCDDCQQTKWYHIQRNEASCPASSQARTYKVSPAPRELWQQVAGVTSPDGNPSVSEFTRRQARMPSYESSQDFSCVS